MFRNCNIIAEGTHIFPPGHEGLQQELNILIFKLVKWAFIAIILDT